MKPTADIKLTKEEAKLLLKILESQGTGNDISSRSMGRTIFRIWNKIWGQAVCLPDWER